MKNGSTPNPAGDAAETKEAYIVVEIFQGGYGDCNLFFSSASALAHIIQAGKTNPQWPPTKWRDADEFFFSAIPNYQHRLTLDASSDGALFFHVRKISLSHQQQDGSAPQLDMHFQPEEPNTPFYIVCEFYKGNLPKGEWGIRLPDGEWARVKNGVFDQTGTELYRSNNYWARRKASHMGTAEKIPDGAK